MNQNQRFRVRFEEIKRAVTERQTLREALQPKLEALQAKLSELESANAERWELLKTGVEVAFDDLEQTYEAIKEVGTHPEDHGPKSAASAGG